MKSFEKKFLLGVGITSASKDEILEFIITSLKKSAEQYYIVTPNPELLVLTHADSEYKEILNQAKLALPDGVGVLFGARLLGIPIKERVVGVDLVKSLCKVVSKQPITVGFLGGRQNVAEKTSECLQKMYPGLKVGLISQEWSEDFKEREIDLLFVAFGSPKQEIWIAQNLKQLPARVVIGVGGAFDFISGKVPRAPVFIQNIGLEWLFRLIVQPWRIKRQLRLIKFIFLILKEKFS